MACPFCKEEVDIWKSEQDPRGLIFILIYTERETEQ